MIESDEVISREVASPFLGTGKSPASSRNSFGEEFKSVRTSFGSCVEEDGGGSKEIETTQPTVERRIGIDSVFSEEYQSARASFGSHKGRHISQNTHGFILS